MSERIDGKAIVAAMRRVADALETQRDALQRLDQASGDGDLGITAGKIAAALRDYAAVDPGDDLGKYIGSAGLAVNKVASSTMGTLLATGLLRAGKEARGLAELDGLNLAAILTAADQGIQERGKAQLGDKSIVDALHPAAEAFRTTLAAGKSLAEAGAAMIAAAEAGRESVTPLRSKIGRASWQGERTAGQVDPGCEALVIILKAVVGQR
jgi:dihydroxyacetone kinase